MNGRQKINSGVPPQPRTLESQSADNPRGGHETGLRGRKAPTVQHGREGTSSRHVAGVTRESGAKGVQHVFVLDKRGNPLMPCSPARARELLRKGRAVVAHYSPFVIRLKDRIGGATQLVRLGVDPGSKTTGLVISRDKDGVRSVLFQMEVTHRSADIHKRMQQRANYRRGRRSRNLRHRQPRFNNRTRPKGWLTPSILSRVQHISTWAQRIQRWCLLGVINLELVRFDIQLMANPEISGVEYQQGTLAGTEAREYLLIKFNHRCVYCDAVEVPLNLDHVVPRSKGGSNRISNLVLACVPCNKAKSNLSIEVFCPTRAAKILARAKAPLRDAAAVNSTRNAVRRVLEATGLPVECSTGGRTKFNRTQFGIPKTHSLDAACVGEMSGLRSFGGTPFAVKATGRGNHQRTRTDAYGFPRLPFPRTKRMHGFQTGDLVSASVPTGKHAGRHMGRVAVRSTGSFRIGVADGINAKYCHLVQYADGYERI